MHDLLDAGVRHIERSLTVLVALGQVGPEPPEQLEHRQISLASGPVNHRLDGTVQQWIRGHWLVGACSGLQEKLHGSEPPRLEAVQDGCVRECFTLGTGACQPKNSWIKLVFRESHNVLICCSKNT